MAGPFVINDLTLLTSLPGKDAVIPDVDKGYGIQCVGLVKFYSKVPGTKAWKGGEQVLGNKSMLRGTAIATFDADGNYPSHKTGNHACFFIEFTDNGFKVLEQHVKPAPTKIQTRTLKDQGGGAAGLDSGDASCYSLVA